MRASLLLIVAIAVLPMVSACSKPAPKPKLILKTFTSGDAGFAVDIPQPLLDKVVSCGHAYFFNSPEGTYKVVVNTVALANTNTSTPQAKMNRDNIAIDSLTAHAGAYVDTLNSNGSKRLLLNFKYRGFEDSGSTNIIPSPDGHRRLKIKFADNEIVLNDQNPQGAYLIRGYVGDNALYTTSVEGIPEFVKSEEATAFLDSFKIIGKCELPVGTGAP